MRLNTRQSVLITSCVAWMFMIALGLSLLWGYENAPGPGAAAPQEWPVDSGLNRAADRATLIMLAHPRCPCSRASIGELSRLMAQAQGRVSAYVVFVKPEGASEDWDKTDLWHSAAIIPGVNAVVDDGNEARRFHALTSGQTVVYDADGHLIFSGGITGSRGHSGDNAGRSSIVSLLNSGRMEQAETPVFGCSLFGTHSECRETFDDGNKH